MSIDRRELLRGVFGEAQLSEEELTEFDQMWILRHYPRKSFLTESGLIERYFYVVVKGVQALYIIDAKGDKKILGFSYDGSPSGVYDSYLEQSPSDYFLEALTDRTGLDGSGVSRPGSGSQSARANHR